MAAQYDSIAESYQRSKQAPIRRFVEAYSFREMIGDVQGMRVLDLACGEGFYTRWLRGAGAAAAVGVDESARMIELAEGQEHAAPLGIRYVRADVAELDSSYGLGRFDLVAAAYLLHYAPDTEALTRMAANVAAHLDAGGRFVALNENPQQPVERFAGYEQYGFNKSARAPLRDGAEITYWMIAGRDMFKLHARWYSRETYERALRDAGFRTIEWRPLALDPAGIDAHGDRYWREYLDNPPIVGLECRL